MIQYDPKSWIKVITRVHGSVLPRILPRLVILAGLGWFANYAHGRWHTGLPPTMHTLVGVALGLLLVFRTNAAYDRYWEGRRMFGMIINRTRDLARQSSVYITGNDDDARALQAELRRYLSLWYGLLRQMLRGEVDLDAVGVTLTDAERSALEPLAVRPMLVVRWMTDVLGRGIAAGRITPTSQLLMDANVTSLVDSWGAAERIMRTPIPFAYAHHIKSFVALFCYTSPFVLADAMHAFTPLAAAILGYGLFGIEEIGVEIEDPFGHDANDLPLDRFGEVIARDTAVASGTTPGS